MLGATKALLSGEALLHLVQVPIDLLTALLKREVGLRPVVGGLAVVEAERAMGVSTEV